MKNALYILLMALSLAGCQALGVTPTPGEKAQISLLPTSPAVISIDQEKRREDMRLVLMANQGLTNEPRLQAYLSSVAARLNDVSLRKVENPQVHIISDASPGAFAYPSGSIFITIGLLKALKNEDELAFILAHELSHVMIGHTSSEDWTKYLYYSVVVAETGLQIQGAASGVAGKKVGGDGVSKALWAAYGGALLGRDMIQPSRTRQDEDEADYLAIDLMIRAGYNPGAAVSSMDILIQAEQEFGREDTVQLTNLERALRKTLEEKNRRKFDDGKQEQGKGAQQNKGHGHGHDNGEKPEISQNNASGKVASDDGKAKQVPNLNVSSFLMEGLMRGAEAIAKEQSEARRKHRPPQERVTQINTYLDRHYEDAPTPSLSEQSFVAALNATDTRKIIDAYDNVGKLASLTAELANRKLSRKDRQSKEAALRDLLTFLTTGPMAQDNRIRLLMAEHWRKQGREDMALAELEQARRSDGASVVIYRQLIDIYRNKRQPQLAWATMEEAMTRFKEPPGLFPEAIILAKEAGRKEKVTDLLIRCKTQAPELSPACSQASSDGQI